VVPLKPVFKQYFFTGIEDLSGPDAMDLLVNLTGLHETMQQEEWEKHKKTLLAEWITASPGSRPWAWWMWDSPGPRQLISGTGTVSGKQLYKGVPLYWRTYDEGDLPTYESEASYLDRHGLLKADERRRVRPASWDPESITQIIPTQLVISRRDRHERRGQRI
jgi:hypothetical protein